MAQRSPDVGGDDDAYADEPAPLAPKQIATLLDASRRAIILEVEALVPHGDFQPMPGIWSPNEVEGHLIEADKRGFQVGDVTVRDILHERVHHDRDHLAQLTALTQRPVWPGMGNARRFSQPDA
jgi:hypothetical protein